MGLVKTDSDEPWVVWLLPTGFQHGDGRLSHEVIRMQLRARFRFIHGDTGSQATIARNPRTFRISLPGPTSRAARAELRPILRCEIGKECLFSDMIHACGICRFIP